MMVLKNEGPARKYAPPFKGLFKMFGRQSYKKATPNNEGPVWKYAPPA